MNGVILVNKEKNRTSRDMVNDISHIFNIKKVGHTGTLDPIATGVLVVCIGKYTKLVNMLSAYKKEYIATIKLGIKTDTLDITGNILEKKDFDVNENQIIEVLNSFKGKFLQTIPLYSAKKINGKKLYEYARNNEKVELPKNEVEIFDINLLSFENDEITFKCEVSKGTYVRSLIEKICEKLGTVGCMNSLIRTKQGEFSIDQSYAVEDIRNGNFKMLKCCDLFNYKIYNLEDNLYQKVKNGCAINIPFEDQYVILYYKNDEVAIYEKKDDIYKPCIMLI